MQLWEAGVLGAVEGLTEFLPISSTGHLILTGHFLGLADSEANKAFAVIIQAGAILAVIWHYRQHLMRISFGEIATLLLAFLPAAVIGLLAHKWIKAQLFGTGPVVAALIVGGVAMIALEKILHGRGEARAPTTREALGIGFAQCLAMWPGTSRSMVTIMGARVAGLNSVRAAEFSFLLALPTLLAATAWDMLKHRHEILASSQDIAALAVGLVTSFVVALVVIRAFLHFLTRHSMALFGYYRIALGLLVLLLT